MQPGDDFQALIRRIRAGDPAAAADLVREYEPEIRRTVRVRLSDRRLRRTFDSMDICQSVLGAFFAHVALGQFELDRPEQVLKLLVSMARNKLNDHVRREHAQRRDNRRLELGSPEELAAQAGRSDTPSRIVAGRELLQRMRQELSPEEQHLAEQRVLGRDWAALAAELHATPDALRMKLNRAVDRVSRLLGTEEP
jgi:RNA polymerase sigma factor (sigma-70 family)